MIIWQSMFMKIRFKARDFFFMWFTFVGSASGKQIMLCVFITMVDCKEQEGKVLLILPVTFRWTFKDWTKFSAT